MEDLENAGRWRRRWSPVFLLPPCERIFSRSSRIHFAEIFIFYSKVHKLSRASRRKDLIYGNTRERNCIARNVLRADVFQMEPRIRHVNAPGAFHSGFSFLAWNRSRVASGPERRLFIGTGRNREEAAHRSENKNDFARVTELRYKRLVYRHRVCISFNYDNSDTLSTGTRFSIT